MIAPPIRAAAPARAASTGPARTASPLASAAAALPPSETLAPDAPNPNTDAVQAAVDAKLADMIARATSPQDEALDRQRQAFDFVASVMAEGQREMNVLRDMAMEQMKNDEEIVKKWIALI